MPVPIKMRRRAYSLKRLVGSEGALGLRRGSKYSPRAVEMKG